MKIKNQLLNIILEDIDMKRVKTVTVMFEYFEY